MAFVLGASAGDVAAPRHLRLLYRFSRTERLSVDASYAHDVHADCVLAKRRTAGARVIVSHRLALVEEDGRPGLDFTSALSIGRDTWRSRVVRLLLLEDDAETREHIALVLRSEGHEVDAVEDGPAAVAAGLSGEHDVLVLDRMVPRLDGLSVLRALRAAGVRTPALFLTALGEVADRVEGLEAGGDDYLVKPFASAELLARIGVLGRRSARREVVTRLSVGGLELDLLKRTVTRDGRRIDLQQQEYKLLEYLVRHAGQVVTRTMLLEEVWDFHFDPGTNLIESHVSRLRSKIDRGFGTEMIRTVRGSGYRLDAPA